MGIDGVSKLCRVLQAATMQGAKAIDARKIPSPLFVPSPPCPSAGDRPLFSHEWTSDKSLGARKQKVPATPLTHAVKGKGDWDGWRN